VKVGEHRKFYRIRYNTYLANPSIRWNTGTGSSLSVGPSFWYYNYDSSDNKGRFTNIIKQIGSYDSNSISESRMHAGLVLHFISDKRNSPILTTGGYYLSIKAQGYAGLNDDSKSFAQLIPELSVYKNIIRRPAVVIADRIGGAVTMGKTAFYQSAFLGGHENLLGYRQYRYAGQHMAYNNFEIRLGIANVASYILPGQLGITGFYDVGRVWEEHEISNTWHHGVGGGLFFSPAQMAMFQFVMGYSKEGWYPYFTMGFRF
jgi:outer membrane protein assembly factor BamA